MLAHAHRYAVDMQCAGYDSRRRTILCEQGGQYICYANVDEAPFLTFMVWKVCCVQSGAGMAVWGSNPGAVKRPCPDRLWASPRLYRIGTGFLSPRSSGRDVKLTPHNHLVTRLRMNGAIHLLHLYALIAWTGNALPFHLATYNPLDLKRSSKTTLQKLPFPNLF